MSQPKISFCLITKNEEEVISICLNSIKDIASEIIVLDTGSTDNTKKIASNYGAKIFDYKWENDFSKARNISISKASYEWIFVIDADEELTYNSRKIIFDFLKNLKKSDSPYIIRVKLIDIEKTGKTNIIIKKSLFQKDKDLIFVRPIHEHITSKTKSFNLIDSPIELLHHEYKKSKNILNNKHENYIKTLEKIIRNEQNISEKLRYMYLMGISYEKNYDYDKAIDTYNNAISLYNSSNKDRNTIFYTNINVALIQLLLEKNVNKAEKHLIELLKDYPNNPEYLFYIARAYQIKQDFKKAIFYYENLISIFSDDSIEKKLSYKVEENLFFYTMLNLGRLYLVIDLKKSIYFFDKAYTFSKTGELVLLYTLCLLSLHDYKKALDIYSSFFKTTINEINYFKTLNNKDIRFKNFIVEFLSVLKNVRFKWYKKEINLIEENINYIKNSLIDISICLITENNQESIENTFNKILNISESIFIIDKNSTDNTINLSKKFTKNIFKVDFSKDYIIKNLFIDKFKSLNNVLFLKAEYFLNNEFLENIIEFLSFLFKKDDKNIVVYIKHKEAFVPSIFKNLYGVKFTDNNLIKYEKNISVLEVFTSFEFN